MDISIVIAGTSALICQSDRIMQSTYWGYREYKELCAKRKKTDTDIERLARIEWEAALYISDGGPAIPPENVFASFRDGGRLSRMGADVERALLLPAEWSPLEYDGPRTPEEMWEDGLFRFDKSVVVQRARTMRCRPIFREWSVRMMGGLLDEMMNLSALQAVARDAGRYCGLGTYRRGGYGRFTVRVEEVLD